MRTYYLHVTNCTDEDFLRKLEEVASMSDVVMTTPVNPFINGFFLIFETFLSYKELVDYFIENFQKKNSYFLIDITNSNVSLNQLPELTSLLLKKIPQASLIPVDENLEDLPTLNLQKLLQHCTTTEDYEKCSKITEILKTRE